MNMAMFRELEGNWFVALTKFGWNSLLTKIKGEPKENSSARRESKAAS
jgi:heme oxygenase